MHRFLPALVRREGLEVRLIDVAHRARAAGRTKYTNFGRALVGVQDLLGVWWLLRRRSSPRVVHEDVPRGQLMQWLMRPCDVRTGYELVWVGIGLGGQAMFMLRFVVQWIVSERARRSVIPVSFWWLSIAGAAILLAYAIHRRDPVFILGQSLGFSSICATSG